jgi:hypothetical protein
MNAAFIDYEKVLETHNTSDIAFIKSILSAYEITYFIQGEFAAPYMYYGVPMRVLVKKEQAAEAREILKEIELCYTTFDFNNQEYFDETE